MSYLYLSWALLIVLYEVQLDNKKFYLNCKINLITNEARNKLNIGTEGVQELFFCE